MELSEICRKNLMILRHVYSNTEVTNTVSELRQQNKKRGSMTSEEKHFQPTLSRKDFLNLQSNNVFIYSKI